MRDSHAHLTGRHLPLVTVNGMSRQPRALAQIPAASTEEVFMLMPLVKASVLSVAGLDRVAAGSPGFCLP